MSGPTSTHRISLRAVALNTEGGQAPEWIELIPAGDEVVGVDGRRWINPNPQAVVDATGSRELPLPLDWEHATQEKAPKGEEAPAAAWIEELQVRDGAIWGRAEWTPRARDQVANREYRFVSPAFAFNNQTRAIERLVSVGLTNTPNLHLTALNREGLHREQSETTLDLAALRKALGLADNADDAAILAAVTSSVAANRAGVDLTQYAPRADLETAVNRATAAEGELKARKDADHTKAIDAALDAAQAEGKITPASRETYLAMCKVEGGLERFNALVATLPVIASNKETKTSGKDPKDQPTGDHGLSETELAVCRQLGQDPAEYAKAKKEA